MSRRDIFSKYLSHPNLDKPDNDEADGDREDNAESSPDADECHGFEKKLQRAHLSGSMSAIRLLVGMRPT